MSTLRGFAQLADLQGTLCPRPIRLQHGVVFDLTCYFGSVPPISPIVVFVAILLLFSIEPPTPVSSRVASQWRERLCSSNGDHYRSKDGRGPSCWSPGTYHKDDTFRLRADDTALRSTLLVSGFGRISYLPVGPRHMDHSAAELPKPHPPDLFAPRSASMLHPARIALRNFLHISASSQHKPQDCPSTCTFFARRGLGICTRRHGQAYWNKFFE